MLLSDFDYFQGLLFSDYFEKSFRSKNAFLISVEMSEKYNKGDCCGPGPSSEVPVPITCVISGQGNFCDNLSSWRESINLVFSGVQCFTSSVCLNASSYVTVFFTNYKCNLFNLIFS